MPIAIFWDDEAKTIIRVQFTKQWTWEEYDEAVNQLTQLAATISHRFDQIITFEDEGTVPVGNMLAHIGRGINITPQNLVLIVYISPPQFIRRLIAVLNTTIPLANPTRVLVNTLAEAYDYIQSSRAGT